MRLLSLAKLPALSFAVFLICGLTSAQAYAIRVDFNTNLRNAPSLDANVVTSAPAGATLQVTGAYNRWLKISHNGGEVWMADWVSYSRVESSPQPSTETQSAMSAAPVDNCCFVDRECHSDQDWTDGYWAFQNMQCAAPSQTQPGTSVQIPAPARSASVSPAQIDNCCFAGWQCHTDEDWRNGYQAYQEHQCNASQTVTVDTSQVDNCCRVNQQCATEEDWQRGWAAYQHYQCDTSIPITIVGGGGFRAQMTDSLLLLKRTSPKWYGYTISGLKRIVQTDSYEQTYVDTSAKTFYLHYSDHPPEAFSYHSHLVFTAGIFVHEACHVHRYEAGLVSGGLEGEKACTEVQLAAHLAIDPHDPRIAEHRETLANIHDPSTWWWN